MPLRRTGLDGRRSLRLPDHDYASSATYFVTVCTYEKLCWFGDIVEGQLVPTRAGEIVDRVWSSLPNRYEQVLRDAYITMPNHFHGLLTLRQGTTTLGAIIRTFKGASTFQIRADGEGNFGWQRNYHEHIVRNSVAFDRIRTYIQDNPRTWENDVFHPLRESK